MANALDLAGTGFVNAGRVAAVDNVQVKTMFVLYRGGSLATGNTFVTKRQSSGGGSGWDVGINVGVDRWTTSQEFSPSATFYSTAFGSLLNTASTWHWLVVRMNLAAGAGDNHAYYAANFGETLTTVSLNASILDGAGTLVDDSGNNIVIGGTPALSAACNAAVAFVGQINSALSISAAQAVINSMATASWAFAVRLGWGGAATAPDFTGTLSPTVGGTTSLVTTAPEYWTGAGGGPNLPNTVTPMLFRRAGLV